MLGEEGLYRLGFTGIEINEANFYYLGKVGLPFWYNGKIVPILMCALVPVSFATHKSCRRA